MVAQSQHDSPFGLYSAVGRRHFLMSIWVRLTPSQGLARYRVLHAMQLLGPRFATPNSKGLCLYNLQGTGEGAVAY
jgi:hypothetical protein